ncbi:LysR family transcriptional regulator [Dyella sp. C9]|uniref:LysR family transcriptional regulator n=1 Tax=Dyella sp. C9 TaxID=2202154 RepID=UPI000DEEAF21|nr:LysR family transcriptional regulator [Dyella sp. C9]
MDVRQLRAFLTVATTGSVTKAATLIDQAQPAVSRQIRLLEEEVGQALFVRTRWGVELTEAGQTLLGYARRALEQLDRAREALAADEDTLAGVVTVGLPPSTIERLAALLTLKVRARHPGIVLRFVSGYSGRLEQWLQSGELDVALVQHAMRPLESGAQPLLEEPLWAVGPASAGLSPTQPIDAQAFLGHPLVLPSAAHVIRARMEELAAQQQCPLNVVAEADAMAVQKSLAHAGVGFTVLPASVVQDELQRGWLSATPFAGEGLKRTLGIATSPTQPPGKAARHVATALSACVASLVAQGQWPGARWLGEEGMPS